MRVLRIVRTALFLTLTCAACSGCVSWLLDGKTGATKTAKRYKSGFIPEPSDTYHVVGERDGLAGFVVRYDSKFYRGGELKSEDAAKSLKAWGVKTIVSVVPSDRERKFAAAHDFALEEVVFEKDKALSPRTLALLERALKSDGGPYYAHCDGGTQRGGAVGVFFRMHVQGVSFEDAAMEFKRLGGDYEGNEALLKSIADYRP